MSSFNRFSYLASQGNYPVKEAGKVVILPGDSNDVYNVLTGEIVIWNPKKNITLSVADIATEKYISIGIGVGPKGDLAQDIMHIAGEQFNMCDAQFNITTTPPECAVPQIVDVFFDKVKYGDSHTIVVRLDDSKVRSTFGYNDKAEYTFTVEGDSWECVDCDAEASCEELACKFVEQINGTIPKDPSMITYFRKADLAKKYQPFEATQLYVGNNTSKTFCLPYKEDDCQGCKNYKPITGVKIDGQVYDFEFTTTPSGDMTLESQLERIINNINKTFKDHEAVDGHAIKVKGIGECCEPNFEINSCATEVKLIIDGAEVDPCEEHNPFTAKDLEASCTGCPIEAATFTPTCGVRLIVDPVTVPCDCQYPPNMPAPNLYTRSVEVQFAGEGWSCGNHYSKVRQEQGRPEGFGYFYQDRAHYGNHNGGTGRDFRNSNKKIGRIGLPDAGSRMSNAMNLIKCDEMYCVYNIESVDRDMSRFTNAVAHYNKDLTQLLIPSKDAVTKTSFEAYLNALRDRGVCKFDDVQCG